MKPSHVGAARVTLESLHCRWLHSFATSAVGPLCSSNMRSTSLTRYRYIRALSLIGVSWPRCSIRFTVSTETPTFQQLASAKQQFAFWRRFAREIVSHFLKSWPAGARIPEPHHMVLASRDDHRFGVHFPKRLRSTEPAWSGNALTPGGAAGVASPLFSSWISSVS